MSFAKTIPDCVYRSVCWACGHERTCCATVKVRKRYPNKAPMCSACRIAMESQWDADVALETTAANLADDEPRARRLGIGLRARSPSKHNLPFTF